ncbi:MAG: hypothetical protein OEY14_17590, partial [Myxococcales bacterium]|nr:hypothetical protein [Myxococcales bacterium]
MAQLPLRIDYALAMASGLGGSAGLEDAHLAAEAPAFERGLRRIQAEAEAGRLGFWNLPRERTSLRRIEEAVPALLEGVEDVLLLGIGGSSLGARAIYHALCGPAELRRGGPRLHLPDNSDPWTLARMMEQLDPRRTLVV